MYWFGTISAIVLVASAFLVMLLITLNAWGEPKNGKRDEA